MARAMARARSVVWEAMLSWCKIHVWPKI